jgi:hypothetical protein
METVIHILQVARVIGWIFLVGWAVRALWLEHKHGKDIDALKADLAKRSEETRQALQDLKDKTTEIKKDLE